MILTIMKRLSSLLILTVLLVFSFDACKKKEPLVFTIEGQIFDKSFNQSLEGGVVRLFRVPAATTQEILVEQQTISNGSYKFVFDRDRSEKYVIRFSKENYFDEVFTVFFSQLQVGQVYTLNFGVDALSYMNWVFVDQPPINENVSVTLQKLNGRTTGAGACPNQQYEYYGGSVSDTLRCAVGGNQYIKFYVIKLPNVTLDSVFCPAFEQSYYTVNF
jgi:hypothetical protein